MGNPKNTSAKVIPPQPTPPAPAPTLAVFNKPSVMAALKASAAENDQGFTAEDMRKAWGYENISSSVRRIKKLVDAGVFEVSGSEEHRDSMGRPYRRVTYRVVEKEAAKKKSRKIS